jgi:hypothetical protein
MADEETQGQVDTSWEAPAAPTEPSQSSTGFDEPLVWPESLTWDDLTEARSDAPELSLPEVPVDPDGAFAFPPLPDAPAGADMVGDLDAWWETPVPDDAGNPAAENPAAETGAGDTGAPENEAEAAVDHSDPLGGLGGGAGWAVPAADAALPDSFWADGGGSTPAEAFLVTSTLAAPTVYAETERSGPSRRRRFDIRSGNAAVIGLISLVSLALLGMFLSVRGRDDVPTDVSQQRPPGDQIAVTTPLNTVPFSPTTSPPATIDIAGLVPATQAPDDTTAPATTAATTRSTTATTAPAATQPTTATTAAPATTSTAVTTTVTTTPVEDTTTTLRRTTTSFTIPSFPSTSVPTRPTIPPITLPF